MQASTRPHSIPLCLCSTPRSSYRKSGGEACHCCGHYTGRDTCHGKCPPPTYRHTCICINVTYHLLCPNRHLPSLTPFHQFCEILTQCNFEATKRFKVETCPLHMHSSHADACCVLCLRWLLYYCFLAISDTRYPICTCTVYGGTPGALATSNVFKR